jgi:hypothetical protein
MKHSRSIQASKRSMLVGDYFPMSIPPIPPMPGAGAAGADVAGAVAGFTQQLPPIEQVIFPLSSILQQSAPIFLQASPQQAIDAGWEVVAAGFVAGAGAIGAIPNAAIDTADTPRTSNSTPNNFI